MNNLRRAILSALRQAVRKECQVSLATSKGRETPKPFEDIPHATMVPFIGTSWLYMPLVGHYRLDKHHLAFFEKQKRFGDIVRERFGKVDIVLGYLPEHFQIMCKAEGVYPSRGEVAAIAAYRRFRKDWYSTIGLLSLEGKEWRDLRRKVQVHLMTPKAMRPYLGPMHEISKDLVQRLAVIRDSHNEIPDIMEELYKWSLETVSYIGLDTKLGCLQPYLPEDSDANKMIRAVHTHLTCLNALESISGNIPFWKMFPTPTWKRFVGANDVISEISFKYIMQAARNLNEPEEKDTFIQNLMRGNMELPDAMVSVTDIIVSGIDTTSSAMGFFLYNLARNPEQQEILHQEIIKNVPTESTILSSETLSSLTYLRAAMKESHRLLPISPGIPRLLKQDVELSGYKVPAGKILLVLHQVIGRDPRFFSNPDIFQPERWLRKESADAIDPHAQAPFGFGVRSCIGRRLAEQQMICLAIELLRRFRLEYHHEDIGMTTRMLNVPDRPITCTLIERHE